MKNYGVYALINEVNLKMYVGKGKIRPDKTCDRWDTHLSEHCHNEHLKNAFKQIGADNFTFGWLETGCSEHAALMFEQKHIAFWQTTNQEFGYNLTWGGEGASPTEETKRKIATSHLGQKLSIETKQKIGDWHRGKVISAKQRSIVSAIHKGVPKSAEHGRKIGQAQLGNKACLRL